MTLHIPVLRWGEPYQSLDRTELASSRNGQVQAVMSQANAGMIRRDLRRARDAATALRQWPVRELWEICERAGELFVNAELPVGQDGRSQTPEQYVASLSETSGLPYTLCRQNMKKVHHVLTNIRSIVGGLTRGIDDLDVFDRGRGRQQGVPVSFVPLADVLGVVLPSNSPGVNSIWLPALALKTPVFIKPGREEPWTPWRIIQALLVAGYPPVGLSFFPTDHEGADAIMAGSDRAIIFGDDKTLSRYAGEPSVQTHGTGRSKVLIGEDLIDRWEDLIDVLVESVAANGGRSCINASCILVPRHADAIADALAKRLGRIMPRAVDDEAAVLSAFANPAVAEFIDATIEEGLAEDGAVDVTAPYREGPRRVTFDGGTYLLPTIVRCPSMDHPLANTEMLFAFSSVVELQQDRMLDRIGPSLVVTAITRDGSFTERLLACPLIDRLNLGSMPTCHVQWDQPHEGNVFDFLFRRRAIQSC